MKIVQVITDYIRRSILTTQGDMVVRGASLPERLVAVAVGQVLKSGGVGALPAWGKPSLNDIKFDMREFQRSTAGNEVITGVGFTPSLVIFFAVDNDWSKQNLSWGFDDATSHRCSYMDEDGTDSNLQSSYSINIKQDATNHIRGAIASMDADGYTITFALGGARVADILALAIG